MEPICGNKEPHNSHQYTFPPPHSEGVLNRGARCDGVPWPDGTTVDGQHFPPTKPRPLGVCEDGCGEMGVCHKNRDAEVASLQFELSKLRGKTETAPACPKDCPCGGEGRITYHAAKGWGDRQTRPCPWGEVRRLTAEVAALKAEKEGKP